MKGRVWFILRRNFYSCNATVYYAYYLKFSLKLQKEKRKGNFKEKEKKGGGGDMEKNRQLQNSYFFLWPKTPVSWS